MVAGDWARIRELMVEFGRDPDYKSLRWLNGQSPPDLPDGLNRKLLQDIGLDRSRT